MIPYTTCMRFNGSLRRPQHVIVLDSDGTQQPNHHQWTLVPHQQNNQESVIVHSQDDQTLYFSWILDTHQASVDRSAEGTSGITSDDRHVIECISDIHQTRNSDQIQEEDIEIEESRGYLLITLRRRKSIQRSIHIDPIALLDHSYYGITSRLLKYSSNWHFNTFTLDVLTGGHSLSSLLFHLFIEYDFIKTFNLDVINVMRCFRFLEAGYHDTNPYHNSVHAADVTQAMHCFILEPKIRQYLTPMEAMCALLAAVCHDLDHPGVNQHFLIATKSHLAALYKNFSVLESHHWRFAMSCFHESQIFEHFSAKQWQQIESIVKLLILATDITRQSDYIAIFRKHLSDLESFSMTIPENRHFILQIALKCADLANPCRPWNLSKRWSQQICNEFYRQGDYEKQLNIPITPICNRQTISIARIQTDFFKNIVNPLFELWDQYLCSPLSKQLINNLRFNDNQWNHSLMKKTLKRRHSIGSIMTAKQSDKSLKQCISLNDLKDLPIDLSLTQFKSLYEPKAKQCINGCGTPPNCQELYNKSDNKSKVLWELQTDEEEEEEYDDQDFEDEDEDRVHQYAYQSITTNIKTYSLQMPSQTPIGSYLYDKKHMIGRRGSAPGCIGIYASCELAAALVFFHGAVANQDPQRRSSFPAEKVGRHSAHSLYNISSGAKLNRNTGVYGTGAMRGKSLEYLVSSLKKNKSFYHSTTSAHTKLLRRQACSLDSGADTGALQWFFNNKPRRGSVPQEILIESLANYTT
ncbi:high affinity cAMP-specific 3',5'-cyclic phosphodiesterase 7A-like [Oppia nitens]|uniref:high affinity cAMP-specific 3',5'-cyclic phosphodiesterase 7A-like n=1 Tax=Oppia nitens TaxID=1686743 RepID=UPI0023DAFA0C|nr:high affinity cAMP-specific 3',5'-cyclic phosphodiesterase 7A-like [Oppia nitens]